MLRYKFLSISRQKNNFCATNGKKRGCLRIWTKLYDIWHSELGWSNFKSAKLKKQKQKVH